jgi:Tfp pilus assembly protein PilO
MMTETQKQVTIAAIILGVLLTILAVYLWFMVVAPKIAQNATASAAAIKKAEESEGRIEEMRNVIENRAEWEELQAKVEIAKQRLPTDPRSIEFLQLLRDGLSKTNVQQTGITADKPERRPMYQETPYTIEGFARYHDFGQFVNLIECNPTRIMRINEFNLRNTTARPSFHPMTVGVSTYSFTGS